LKYNQQNKGVDLSPLLYFVKRAQGIGRVSLSQAVESLVEEFSYNGYVILEQVITDTELAIASESLKAIQINKAGTRNVLHAPWCRDLALSLNSNSAIRSLLPENAVAVQCTYFDKSHDHNWLVAMHRDYLIPIKQRINTFQWSGWSEKEGSLYVRPPEAVLSQLVAIRVHLEDCIESNGPLQVIPGSHRMETSEQPRESCFVKQQGALVMRPLLLHASSRLTAGRRQVLHFLYGPGSLPDGAEWEYAV
jgi:ectoine hydroxylase-related dioxygenase (phytanoyl-CoA dioxygenase family)